MHEAEPSPDAARRSLLEDVETLIDDGRNALTAELAFQRTRIGYSAKAVIHMIVFGVAAVLLGFFVLIALTVGVLLALIPSVSAWGAAGIVAGAFLLAMLLSIALVWRNWRRLRTAFGADRRQ